jgi:hypothetical protein
MALPESQMSSRRPFTPRRRLLRFQRLLRFLRGEVAGCFRKVVVLALSVFQGLRSGCIVCTPADGESSDVLVAIFSSVLAGVIGLL